MTYERKKLELDACVLQVVADSVNNEQREIMSKGELLYNLF